MNCTVNKHSPYQTAQQRGVVVRCAPDLSIARAAETASRFPCFHLAAMRLKVSSAIWTIAVHQRLTTRASPGALKYLNGQGLSGRYRIIQGKNYFD
jgi:hypothetical protein